MMNRRILFILAIVCLFLFGMAAEIYAAQDKPMELTADTIEYDSVKGVLVAAGGVRLTQGTTVITGASAEYNTKTKEALISGGVKAVKDDAVLTAAQLSSYNDNHLAAVGDVSLTKGENRLAGQKLDYYADREYAVLTGAPNLNMPDGVMKADKIEAFFAENRAVGSGSVYIFSETRKVEATADQATYYGIKGNQNKVVLNGNARAVQDGNVLTGNTLTVYLDDKAMDAQGRTKLVINPQ